MTNPTLQRASLPLTFDEITADWLSDALAPAFPGIEVASVHHTGDRFGTSASARYDLAYNGAVSGPSAVYIKGGFTPAIRKRVWGALQQEARFYAELAADTSLHIPDCYYAGIDEPEQQGIVILEDMSDRGVRFGSYLEPPPGTDTVADALEQLARHHAAWWQDPRLTQYEGWGEPQRGYLRYLVRPKHWAQLVERDYGAQLVDTIPSAELADRALLALWEVLDRLPRTLVHGDPHSWNLFYERDGKPGFADWQLCFPGSFSHDMSWVISSTLGIEQRRADEQQLVRHYGDVLRAEGADAGTFDDLWLLYRQNMAHAFVSGACEPIESGPIAIINELSYRSIAAAQDLDVLSALSLS